MIGDWLHAVNVIVADITLDMVDGTIFHLLVLLGMPILMYLIISDFKKKIFTPDYQRRDSRTKFSGEQPLMVRHLMTGKINGVFLNNNVSWYVFKTGIGISIYGIGKIFLPSKHLDGLGEATGLLRGWRELKHTSPELQHPVLMPSEFAKLLMFDVENGQISVEETEMRSFRLNRNGR